MIQYQTGHGHSELPDDMPDDLFIELITGFLAYQLTPELMEEVTRRLFDDEAFWQRAEPHIVVVHVAKLAGRANVASRARGDVGRNYEARCKETLGDGGGE